MNAMALPLALMVVVMLAELYVLRRFRGEAIPWLDVIANLNSGHLVLWLFRGVEVAAYAWVLGNASMGWAETWPQWLVWLFAFFAWDFGFYWLHRLHHKLGFLWAVHEVHHQGEHFNLSLGIRNSWYSSLTSFPFFALLAVLGVPLQVFVAVSGIHYAIQFSNHSGFITGSGILDRFMVTPRHHRVHHGANPEYIDKNFGGTLLLWDKLFGTFQRALPDVPIQYGTPGLQQTHDPFWMNHLPLLRYARLREPRVPTRPVSPGEVRCVASGGVLIFALVIYYVAHEGSLPGAQQPWLFALLAASTLALGALSDGRWWGQLAWFAVGVAAPWCLVGLLALRDPFGCALLGLLAVHAAVSTGWWMWSRRSTRPI
jgi:sterol desaturase/sphingolipid hydroxylase (fatty acid hydroxylase superfamily)